MQGCFGKANNLHSHWCHITIIVITNQVGVAIMVGSMFMAMVGAELLYDHICDKIREIFKQQKPAPDIERLHPAELVGTFSRYKWPLVAVLLQQESSHQNKSKSYAVCSNGCFDNKYEISWNLRNIILSSSQKNTCVVVEHSAVLKMKHPEMRNFWRVAQLKVKGYEVVGVSGCDNSVSVLPRAAQHSNRAPRNCHPVIVLWKTAQGIRLRYPKS